MGNDVVSILACSNDEAPKEGVRGRQQEREEMKRERETVRRVRGGKKGQRRAPFMAPPHPMKETGREMMRCKQQSINRPSIEID